MKTIHNILIMIFLLSSLFLQGQDNSKILLQQINELIEQRNFVDKTNCPQQEVVIKEYQENFDVLINTLNLAYTCFNTPLSIEESRIKEQTDGYVKYQSTNLSNVLVKRYGVKTSISGLFSGGSSMKVGSKTITESFSIEGKKVEARYYKTKKSNCLLSFSITYDDKTRIYMDFIAQPQAHINVYNTNEYGSEFKKIQLIFDPSEIGKINYLNVNNGSYELYRGRYTEILKDDPRQSIVKHKYGIRCNDNEGNTITRTITGREIEIKPTVEILWYAYDSPVNALKFMVKRVFDKEEGSMVTKEAMYGYDNTKKWSSMDDDRNILQEDFVEKSSVTVYNDHLKLYTWDNEVGKTGIKNIPSLIKEFPKFTYKATIKEELSNLGDVTRQLITGLNIYTENQKTQTIPIEEEYNLDYFDLIYVDANYDGYLDLSINNTLYFYQPKTQKFELDNDLKDDYFPEITELYNYNLFTKSITAQYSRRTIEYRAINHKLTPYESESFYMGEDYERIITRQKYENGKWKVIEERIEGRIEDEEEPTVSAENFNLVFFDLDFSNKSVYFSPIFRNEIGEDIFNGKKAKLYSELKDANGNTQRHFLYNTIIDHGESQLLDDGELIFDGEKYFLLYSNKILPFFPSNLNQKKYNLSLVIEHSKFGEVHSDSQKITFPLPMEINTDIKHLKGTIGTKVTGDIYFKKEDEKVIGTFINAKTGKNIDLKGTYVSSASGGDTVNFQEFEKSDELSGYFEGTIDKENPEVYKGNWLSPDRKMSVPFEFKKE